MLLDEIKSLKIVKSNYIYTSVSMLKEIQNIIFKWKDNYDKRENR